MALEISRSEQKRRVKQVEMLVAELGGLPLSLIGQLPCSEEIRTLLRDASSMKGGSRKRQIKYITKLLKDEPLEELYTFLSERKGAALQEKKEFKEVEFLRDALLNEAIEQQREAEMEHSTLEEDWQSRVVEKICDDFQAIDRALIKRLAWLYARTRDKKHSRELFRLLRAAQEQQRWLRKNS